MSDLHTQLGALAIGLNVLAALIGTVAWLVRRNPKPFWWSLRAGQILIMIEAVIGAALLLDGLERLEREMRERVDAVHKQYRRDLVLYRQEKHPVPKRTQWTSTG